jgi:hypothetical protein
MENNFNNLLNLEMSPKLREDLRTASTWGRLVAIMGLCSSLFSLLRSFSLGGSQIVGGLISVTLSVVLYIFLLKFGSQVKKGIDTNDQEAFNDGLVNLKMYFKIIAYLIIIFLIIAALAILFIIVLAMLKS